MTPRKLAAELKKFQKDCDTKVSTKRSWIIDKKEETALKIVIALLLDCS